ncbi:uncharacterized protein Z519_09331 [Cladophialophora bantiana CBS 173.52]|uniref:Uncharacterized protein n=1 Tax=Cladophialophora bantiana (strain ATCC 10958 / CBS 173.52 / CDC B-1940 / NIH 8579) TaxID=1442370 RepID=A0A0D2FTN4_CLAB1|nr:uncharacterized protein Z519_09331 [Cladophialophora bantiana CBS 173.52]KIW89902.1 hypothetical protein Z519_09331 [Cladophialophora bantiana CBS 173.52]
MTAFLDKLKVTRSEGMSGIGPGQGALRDKLETSNGQSSGADPSDELGSGKGQKLDRGPNTFGGPSFGRTSSIPRHESEALNKMDPRIGYDADGIPQEELERYETKYGKPSGNTSDARMRGTDMAGIGPDQSVLEQTPGFRARMADQPEK